MARINKSQSIRDCLILYFYKLLGRNAALNFTVRVAYRRFIFPFYSLIFKLKFNSVRVVYLRHSIEDGKHFNAFLSDIDTTIVISNEVELDRIYSFMFQIKKIFPMFDVSEIYTIEEEETLKEIKSNKHFQAVESFWQFRKLNWSLAELSTTNNNLVKIKKRRSIEISHQKISFKKNKALRLSEMYCFTQFFEKGPDEVCSYSKFLETHRESSMPLLMTARDFETYRALLPMDDGNILKKENQELYEIKKLIHIFELLKSKNSLRLSKYLKIDSNELEDWVFKLEAVKF